MSDRGAQVTPLQLKEMLETNQDLKGGIEAWKRSF